MKEVDLQKRIVDAVLEYRGMGHKMSNRFLIGVADVLLKLPNCPALIAEVKITEFKLGINPKHRFKLGVTHLQKKFLINYEAAGMHVAIISGVQIGRFLSLKCVSLDEMDRTRYTLTAGDHTYNGYSSEQIELMLRTHINDRLSNR